MTNHCGSCTACCRVYAIPEFKKPAGKWCDHCAVGSGCKIYDARPERCVEFECIWLQSQRRPEGERFPAELRPDRCKVVFGPTTNPMIISATTMSGANDAWKRGSVSRLISRLVNKGFTVAISAPGALRNIVLDRSGQRDVMMSEPDENGMQWSEDIVLQGDGKP